jgi:mannose-6-phosphate isomerase-like protein (cupin superfamily)
LKVDGKEYELIKGDSFYFHSYLPHTMHNTSGTQKLRILCVCTPSAF